MEILRKYLLGKKEDIRSLLVKPRDLKLVPTKLFVSTVVGARRAGKTYFMYDLVLNRLGLGDEEFLYMNFEDLQLRGAGGGLVEKAVDAHQEAYGKLPEYIFLDEIQGASGWEGAVYSLYEKKRFHIVVTGSSSKLLSKEIATQLRGRGLTYTIHPLSFKEFLKFRGFELPPPERRSGYKENEAKHMLLNYLRVGGFPDVVLEERVRDRFFSDYLDLLTFKDLVERYGIKNLFVVKYLVNAALSSFSKDFSINAVYSRLKGEGINVSRKTLYSYANLLEDAFFAFYCRRHQPSSGKSMLSIPKVYINDTGILSALAKPSTEGNMGRIMENAVFIEILRRRGAADEVSYWRDYQGNEVDFVVKEGGEVKRLVQVTYASGRDEVERRELRALEKASGALGCGNMEVITWDYEGEEAAGGRRVRFVPLWKWLLGEGERTGKEA